MGSETSYKIQNFHSTLFSQQLLGSEGILRQESYIILNTAEQIRTKMHRYTRIQIVAFHAGNCNVSISCLVLCISKQRKRVQSVSLTTTLAWEDTKFKKKKIFLKMCKKKWINTKKYIKQYMFIRAKCSCLVHVWHEQVNRLG